MKDATQTVWNSTTIYAKGNMSLAVSSPEGKPHIVNYRLTIFKDKKVVSSIRIEPLALIQLWKSLAPHATAEIDKIKSLLGE